MHATCHCGCISIDVPPPKPSPPLNECQCSVCSRYGVIWAYYPLDQVKVTKAEGASTRTYMHGGRNVGFHFCETCNGLMYWWPTDEKRIPRMAINARMVMDKESLEGVEIIKGMPQKREEQKEC